MIFSCSTLGFIKVVNVYCLKSMIKKTKEKVSHSVGENVPRLHSWSDTQNIQCVCVCEACVLTANESTNKQV